MQLFPQDLPTRKKYRTYKEYKNYVSRDDGNLLADLLFELLLVCPIEIHERIIQTYTGHIDTYNVPYIIRRVISRFTSYQIIIPSHLKLLFNSLL